jgi:hypothetical protein
MPYSRVETDPVQKQLLTAIEYLIAAGVVAGNPPAGGFAIEAGGNLAAILAKLQADPGAGRTYSAVAITQGAAGWLLLNAKATGKTPKLHALLVVADTDASSIVLQSADNDSGGTPVALSGVIPVAKAGNGFLIPPTLDPRLCLGAPAGKSLGLTSATGKVFGWAIVSTD